MTIAVSLEIFFWGNAWYVLHVTVLAKTMKAVDFTETLYKAWTLRKKQHELKKNPSLGGSQMHQCLWVSEDLGLVT